MTEMYNGFRLETPEIIAYEMGITPGAQKGEVKETPNTEDVVDINALLKEYKQYKTMQSEIKENIDRIGNKIKSFMQSEGVDTYYADQCKIIYKTVQSCQVNSQLLRKEYPEVYDKVTTITVTRPLKIY